MRKIVKNAIQCKLCGEIIESTYRHEYVEYKCGACAVDGGHDYLRRCFKDKGCYTDLSETVEISEKIQNNAGLLPSPVVLYCATGGGKFYGYYQRAMVRQRRSVRAMHAGRQADEGAVILDGTKPR